MQWKEDDTKTIVTREAGTPTPGGHCQTQRAEGSQGPNYREGVLPNYVKIEKQAGTELRVTETQDCDKGGGDQNTSTKLQQHPKVAPEATITQQ